jgi:hypothetical protein
MSISEGPSSGDTKGRDFMPELHQDVTKIKFSFTAFNARLKLNIFILRG